MADITLKQGDTQPPVIQTLYMGDGSVADLTDAVVLFKMRRMIGLVAGDSEILVIDAGEAESLGSPEDGIVKYEWADGDTDLAGGFEAEWEVTFENDEVLTFPNGGYLTIAITEQLAGPTS